MYSLYMEIVIVVGTVDNADNEFNPYRRDDGKPTNTTSWESRIAPDFERLWKNLE